MPDGGLRAPTTNDSLRKTTDWRQFQIRYVTIDVAGALAVMDIMNINVGRRDRDISCTLPLRMFPLATTNA